MIGDIKDVKELYKDQIQELLGRIVTIPSSLSTLSIAQETIS